MKRYSHFEVSRLFASRVQNWLDDCHLTGEKGKVRDWDLRLHSHSGSNRVELRLDVLVIVLLNLPWWGLHFVDIDNLEIDCYLNPLLIVHSIMVKIFLIVSGGLSKNIFFRGWWSLKFELSCGHAIGWVWRLVQLLLLKKDINTCIDLNEYSAEAMLSLSLLLLCHPSPLFPNFLSQFNSLGWAVSENPFEQFWFSTLEEAVLMKIEGDVVWVTSLLFIAFSWEKNVRNASLISGINYLKP